MTYQELEVSCTATADGLFLTTRVDEEKEAYRNLTLRIRLAVKRAWEDMGKELPNYRWENPDE